MNPNFGAWEQEDAYKAIIYLAALKNKGNTVIANMSISNHFNTDEELALFKSGIDEAKNAGVIMIAASGNADPKNENPKYRTYPEVDELPAPARWDGVLAIGASKDGSTLADEKRSYYSMYDIPDNPFNNPKLLIVAPVDTSVNLSINIETTYPIEPYYINWFHGTSAACPLVSGTTALLLSINKNFTYSDLEDIFKNTAEKIGNYPKILDLLEDNYIGYHSSAHTVRPTIIEYTDIKNYILAQRISLKRETSHINPLTGEIEGKGGISPLSNLAG